VLYTQLAIVPFGVETMTNRTYAYRAPIAIKQRTHCPDCGSKMLPASGHPRDNKNVCHDRACNDAKIRKAGSFGLATWAAAYERGNCL